MTSGLVGRAAGRHDLRGADIEDAYASPSPWLRANFVAALDGVIEIDGASGALGSATDREIFATQRALADAVLVGAGTARAEDYGPAWLTPERRRRRAERRQPPLPRMVVVSGSADLDVDARLFRERRDDQPEPPRPIVLTSGAAAAACRARLEEVAEVVVCGDGPLDLRVGVEWLRAAGLGRIGCEGGPALLAGLLAAGLVDELCLTHAPVMGGAGRRTLSGSAPALPAPVGFELTDLLVDAGVLFARYRTSGPLDGGRGR